jgi:hypothetical protein
MTIQSWCLIDTSGSVDNVISYDGVAPYTPPTGMTLVQSDVAGIGWTYENGVFTAPVIPDEQGS